MRSTRRRFIVVPTAGEFYRRRALELLRVMPFEDEDEAA
jgi:hypothetical protein